MTDRTAAPAFRIDAVNLCLWRRNGVDVDERLYLAPKTFDVLRYLVENAGRLISHDELLTAVWHDVHVQPDILKSHILAIRNALGDKSANPRFIETRRGRGYRFIGPIDDSAAAPEVPAIVASPGLLAGRAEPLWMLQDLLKRAAAGERQAVFISGEPGIGKSALVQALITEARRTGLIVAQGQCIEGFGGLEPYYPFLEALGRLCSGPERAVTVHTLLKLAPTWAAQMPQIQVKQREAAGQSIDGMRAPMVREGTDMIEALAAEHPVLLVLEDLHWADYATIDLLSALCRRRSPARLVLIGTYRPEELASARHPLKQMTRDLAARKYCHEIELGSLLEPAVAEILMGGPNGVPAPRAFSRFITEWSGGNPLFIELTLEFLQQRGMVERDALGWRLLAPIDTHDFPMPPTIGHLLDSKMAGMPAEMLGALEAASVAGARFDTATVARAAGMDEQAFEAICEECSRNTYAIRRDELSALPNGALVRTYVFKHALYRQALYDRIGQARLAYLHRTIGTRLEEIYPSTRRDDISIQLAQHFAAAGDWLRSLDYVRSALRVANSRFSRRDAAVIIDLAAQFAANLPGNARAPAEIEFLERRAAILAVAKDSGAVEAYVQLADRSGQEGNINVQCRALVGLAYVTSWNDLAGSRQFLDQVLTLAEQQSDPIERDVTRVSTLVRRIWGFGWNGDDAGECSEAVMRLENAGDPLAIARAQISFSMACVVSARYREAHDLVQSGYRLLHEAQRNGVEADLTDAFWKWKVIVPWSLFYLGDFGRALDEFDANIAAFEKIGEPYAAWAVRVQRSILLFYAMDFEGVLESKLPRRAQSPEENAAPAIRPVPLERRVEWIFCGLAKLGLGNNDGARDDFLTAEADMARQPTFLDWYWRLPMEWGMVNLLLADGNYAAATLRAERLCDLAEQTDERTWQSLAWEARARASLSAGDLPGALDHVGKALAACAGEQLLNAQLRVHATCARAYEATGDKNRAKWHSWEGARVRRQIAESLPKGHALRQQFERRSALLFAG